MKIILLLLISIPIIYILIRIILNIIIKKYGKFSFEGFNSFGFTYNSKKDIFVSTRNAWQKNFGYTHLYDLGAPLVGMILDTETIKFNYNNRNYLITFWKGQYGISTGCEIGIYYTNELKINKNTLYIPLEDNELIDMSFILYKNKKYITRLSDKHWWLAAFKLGVFSNPSELTMDISIKFPEERMLDSFLEAFEELGYTNKDYKIINGEFFFYFKECRSKKVITRFWFTDKITQYYNKKKVKLYNKYLLSYLDSQDNYHEKERIIINSLIPDIFKNRSNYYEDMLNKNIKVSIKEYL